MRKWFSGLPTEYQMALLFALLGILCWVSCPLSSVLDKNLSAVLYFLGSLSGGQLLHGAAIRSKWGKDGADQDVKGDLANG